MRASAEELALRNAVEACLPSGPVVVGVSGGADSLALLIAVLWVAEHRGQRVTAVVVDHGLQPGSADIARHAAEIAGALGADDARVVKVSVDQSSPDGLEAAARDARREALRDVAREVEAASIALGHTRDDQAETVLLRLTRGAGVKSLAAMRPCAGLWHRPFLHQPRAVVRSVAQTHVDALGRQIWEDPHNSDPRFARVRARAWLASLSEELGAGLVQGLARSAALAAADSDALEMWADREFTGLVEEKNGEVSADRVALAQLPEAIRSRIIKEMYRRARLPDDAGMDLEFEHVRAVDYLVTEWKGQGPADLPGRVHARVAYGRLCLQRSEE